MRRFRCPKCGLIQEALALACGHPCPSHSNKWVSFDLIQEDNTVESSLAKAGSAPEGQRSGGKAE
jgi:hypothetical protein